MKDFSYYRRGQVYYVVGNPDSRGSIQGGDRPVLVVSNDNCNAHSSVLHVAPITSQAKSQLPTHIKFLSPDRGINTILLEQITCRAVEDFRRKDSRYMYTLSEEIMSQVDKAIAIQFNLPSYSVHLEEFEKTLDSIKQLKLGEIHEEVERLTEDRISHILDRLKVEFNIKIPEKDIPEDAVLEEVEKVLGTPSKVPQLQVSRVEKFSKRYKNFSSTEVDVEKKRKSLWTVERKRQLLQDISDLGIRSVAEKYGITINSCHTYSSKFRKELQDSLGETPEEEDLADTHQGKECASNSLVLEDILSKTLFLENYRNMTLSAFMEKYNLTDRKETVLLANKIKSEIG